MTQTTIHSYFQQMFEDWVANGRFPESTVEACTPAMASKLGVPSEKFTFDSFVHSSQTPEWTLKPIDFGSQLESALFIYLPTPWSEFEKLENAIQVSDNGAVRQTIYLLDKTTWRNDLSKFFQQGEVSAFVYYLIQPPAFHQWICCIEQDQRVWVFAVYSTEDKILVTKADASDKGLLETQLISLINSNPWYGFVKPTP